MPKESPLGPQADRVKTDLRLPKPFVKQVEAVCTKLGIPKNAFFVLAGARFLIQLAPVLGSKKGADLLTEVEDLVLGVVENVKKAL